MVNHMSTPNGEYLCDTSPAFHEAPQLELLTGSLTGPSASIRYTPERAARQITAGIRRAAVQGSEKVGPHTPLPALNSPAAPVEYIPRRSG